MVAGHYAAALIPAAHRVRAPFWLLLFCAQVPEFLWLALALVGIEPTLPASLFDAALANIQVDMRFSHNLVPGIIQAIVTGVVVLAVWKELIVAACCAGLVVVHVLCDYVVGFSHQVMWYPSPSIGLNSYGTMPYVAVLIELAFAMACVSYFAFFRRNHNPLPRTRLFALYAGFALAILALLPAARVPLSAWFR